MVSGSIGEIPPTPPEWDDPPLPPDPMGIYSGPEADLVVGKSHVRWHAALDAAKAAGPGHFPENAFNLKGLLVRVPALPNTIPAGVKQLKAFQPGATRTRRARCEKRRNYLTVRSFAVTGPWG